jgi:diguanylate cyclase (GGDEF)-like protein
MQTDLLNFLCRKNALSYIIFDKNFTIIERQNIPNNSESDIRDLLWELVGLEENILALQNKKNESIKIPMVLRDEVYYDLEIESFLSQTEDEHFIAIMQKKSKQTEAYANVIKEINQKTLIYDTSNEKRESESYKLINKHLLTLHVDLDGIITMVNDACTHFFNLDKDSMHKKHFSEFFHTQKSQLDNRVNIFTAKNSMGKNIFFYADIIPLTNSLGEVIENIIVAQDISHLKRIKKELEFAQEYDTLTGLANRHTFLKQIDKAINKDLPFSVAFIDIDNFHTINEEYGAHAGDMLLKHLSQLLKEFLEEGDFLMRVYGDNFAIIFDAQKNKEYLSAIINELKSLAILNPLYYNSEDVIHFNYTVLQLSYPDDAKNAKEFLELSQKKIKRAKIDKQS